MRGGSPEDVPAALVDALHAGDAARAARLWTRDAKLIAADGQVLEGSEAITEAMQTFVASGARLTIELDRLFVSGDVALATGKLTVSIDSDVGASHSHTSDSVVVYTRGEDGVWRVAIDAPWGLPADSRPQ